MNAPLSNFISGRKVDSAFDMMPVLNPSSGDVISEMPVSPGHVVDEAVAAAKKAQVDWERRPAIERAALLRAIAAKMRTQVDPIAKIISQEQGKVYPLAQLEVNFAAAYLDYMAEWARRIEGEIIQSDRPGENIFLFRKAIGVIGAILPWNFPFFLIVRKLGPALITGNSIVIKPSEETPLNAAAFIDLLEGLDGFIQLVDRKSNMIISGGENVYPSEIEAAIGAHSKVQDVAVVGLPDAKWGERVHAVVVPHPGESIAEAELHAWAKERLSGYKRPRAYSFYREQDMPRNATGKVLYRVLKTQLMEQASAAGGDQLSA